MTGISRQTRPLHLCAAALLGLVPLLGLGCPSSPGDDDDVAQDDDDTTDDDDDLTPAPDDDDAADDDDVTLPDEVCDGPAITFVEAEPNGSPDEANVVVTEDGDVVVTGEISECIGEWEEDIDIFQMEFGCSGEATFELRWSLDDPDANTTDLDVHLYDLTDDDPIFEGENYQPKQPPLERGVVTTGGTVWADVLCWSGTVAQYELTVSWEAAAGDDDDDSTADDDDSTADDDDSASVEDPGGP